MLLPRVRVPAVPQEVLERALRRTWATGMGDIPPGVVPYLVHPWVIANDKLKGVGWTPSRTNEEAISEALFAFPPCRCEIRCDHRGSAPGRPVGRGSGSAAGGVAGALKTSVSPQG